MCRYSRNGYRVVYDPTYVGRSGHCYKDGCVYEHILVMERHLGRRLRGDEVVHHKDGNRSNNAIDNLELTTRSEHSRKHAAAAGYIVGRRCSRCGTPIKKCVHGLCYTCWNLTRRRPRPSADECLVLVATHVNQEIGTMFGVSERMVRKWFEEYGIADRVSEIRKTNGLMSKRCRRV